MIPFESFSYPLFDLNYQADYEALVRSFLSVSLEEEDRTHGLKGLYVHIPFCDTICDFCPFVKSVGSDERIERYLQALLLELRLVGEMRRVQQWTLDAVYVGGGTPSVLTEEQLGRLLAGVRANFTIARDAEISVEVEPKSATASKLDALKDAGVTRVSFGVQTFNPEIRDNVNLTATLDQVHEAIALSTERFSDTNFDLMIGFPGHTVEGVVQEMEIAGKSGIGSVSVYPVDYVMTLPTWLDKIRRGIIPHPGPLDSRAEMFHTARAELRRYFAEQNMYCFGSADAPPTKYMFSILYGYYADECIGVGAGAYSFINGLASYNESSERRYVDLVSSGHHPAAFASPGHAYEKGLVFFPKRLTYDEKDLDRTGIRELYEPALLQLRDREYVSWSNGTITLTELGKRSYSELMVSFFTDQQRRLYGRVCNRLRQDVGVIDDSEWGAGDTRIKTMGAINAMTKDAARH